MNKLKKVGLTALATTLVASSAYAGELSVSGSASLNYSGLSTNSNVNPWTMGDSVTFSGGGDLDNGMTVAVSYELDNAGAGHPSYDDYKLTLGLGDGLGTVTFSGNSVNAGGIDTVKDIIPTAYTPVWENTNGVDNGIAAAVGGRSTASMWGYTNSVGDLTVSLGYNAINSTTAAEGAESSIGLSYTMDGITAVAGLMDDGDMAEHQTIGLKYTTGPITAAIQKTEINYDAAATNDQESMHIGASFAVNENLSLSAGRLSVDIDTAVDDEINTGFSASYTMGSISIGAAYNEVESAGGAANADAEVSTLNIAFAF
jgi:outer membrane protein OmpU